MKAVAGSGMASMSEASMLFQPRMLEPSKPRPSLKISSVNSRMGQLKCCQVPKVSTNLMSTILAPLFFANSITLLGVLMYWFIWFVRFVRARRATPAAAPCSAAGMASAKFIIAPPCGSLPRRARPNPGRRLRLRAQTRSPTMALTM